MVILGLETVSRAGSVALFRDGDARGRAGDPSRTHGERLPGELLDTLSAEQLALEDVDAFAVVAGPGSFTGLRVGIATVQGLALASGRGVIPIPTLEAMVAASRGDTTPSASIVVACLDGQRGDVFYAAYGQPEGTSTAGSWPLLLGPAVGKPLDAIEAVLGIIGDGDVAITGSGAERYSEIASSIPRARLEPPIMPLAVAAVRLAAGRLADAVTPHALRPLYVRRPDAVIARERHQRDLTRAAAETASFEVGPARDAADLTAVAALQQAAFADAWGTAAFERELATNTTARIYVLRSRSGEVVAYCACWLIVDELHINSLAVAEGWRRRGLATRLLEGVSDDARTRGARSATLEVRESNRAARALYERLGFRVEGVRRDYYQSPREDAVILWKRRLEDVS